MFRVKKHPQSESANSLEGPECATAGEGGVVARGRGVEC